MAKKSKTVEAYTDVKELNWEETEEKSEIRNQNSEMLFADGVMRFSLIQKEIGDMLLEQLQKVDPEIRKGNPVWHWALCDDHCTFIFRDGRKVTVSF